MDLLQYANNYLHLYPGQRFILKMIAGLPLSNTERIEFQHPISGHSSSYTEADYLRYLYGQGRVSSPEAGPRAWFVLAMGRRAGKTMLSALFAVHALRRLVDMGNPQRECGMPEHSRLGITSISANKDLTLLDDALHLIKKDAKLSGLLANTTQHYLNFRTPAAKREHPDGPEGPATLRLNFRTADSKALRGSSNYVVLLDEMAFYNEGHHILMAAAPTCALTWRMGGQMIIASTPCKKGDDFHAEFKKCFTERSSSYATQQMLALQLPTWEVNPTIPREFYQMQYANNPSAFLAEYGAEFVARERA